MCLPWTHTQNHLNWNATRVSIQLTNEQYLSNLKLLPPHSLASVWAQDHLSGGGRCIFGVCVTIANVYIDGFNLYYGALRKTPFKWLDLSAFCHRLLPGRTIGRIRYFTARIKPLPHDQHAPARQVAYLRALSTLSDVTIHYGQFVSREQSWPAVPLTSATPGGPPQLTRILRTEEKRSDVNLATILMVDCVDDSFDEVVVVSNDSDLVMPLDYAVQRFGKTVV